jgi:hypothetical protein
VQRVAASFFIVRLILQLQFEYLLGIKSIDCHTCCNMCAQLNQYIYQSLITNEVELSKAKPCLKEAHIIFISFFTWLLHQTVVYACCSVAVPFVASAPTDCCSIRLEWDVTSSVPDVLCR